MKRKFCTLTLVLALVLSMLTVPAGAYYLMDDGYSIFPNEETYQFWETNRVPLDARNIYPVAADNWNFCGEFHDGLVLIHESVTVPPEEYPGLNDNYVDKNGNLVDLNRNRYDSMYSFSEGLAAAVRNVVWHTGNKEPHGVAYVDTNGNEVVPFNTEWRSLRADSLYSNYTGRFEGGRALVMRSPDKKYPDLYTPSDGEWDTWSGLEYAYIDTKGNLLTDWTLIRTRDEIIRLPIYDKNGIWIGHRMDPAAWAAKAISQEQLYKGGKEADGGEQNPIGTPAQPFTPDWHAPELPDYNADAPSLFASTAKVTGFHLGDLDFGGGEVTITNPTGLTDAGVVAVCFVNVDNTNFAGDGDGVFFIPYELAPGESRTYSVQMRGIINQEMFVTGTTHPYAQQLDSHVDSSIWTFENDADLLAFYDSIPYEQFWYPQNHVSEFQPICDGQPGTDWLRDVAGINRQPDNLDLFHYYFPDGKEMKGSQADHATYCQGFGY